jgi:glycerol-3-phosphate dehydrogenase subunit C
VHIAQGIDKLGGAGPKPELVTHPIQLMARAYGLSS